MVEQSWHGVGHARRAGQRSAPRPHPLPARVLAGIVTVQVGAALAIAAFPSGPTGSSGTLPGPTAPGSVAAAGIEPEAPPPRRITVDRLGIDSDLVNLRVQRDGSLEVPADFDAAGWHRTGVAPGNVGPAVLVGHVDSFDGPAVFFRLHELVPSDQVTVTRTDGSVVVFEVYGQETVAKDAFPTDRVYGGTAGPELRLLTCGGSFDEQSRSYTDNVVVYARQVPAAAAS